MRGKRFSIGLKATLAIFALSLFVTGTASAQETVLFSFNGTDGLQPYAGLIFDGSGNLYGTTPEGGAYGYGTVFELTPTVSGGWKEKVVHSFNNNGKDGDDPRAGLILDASGNLYGTTTYGGAYGYGTVFELTPKTGGGWTDTVLHSFNLKDGNSPIAGLILDAAGNLYGTTAGGGAYGYGTVFELTPKTGGGWTDTVLHSFDLKGGSSPYAGLIFDGSGNLYGTTAGGGAYGYGTVFELTLKTGGGWKETVLHTFNNNGTDGYGPYAGLIFDGSGNLYGTTAAGGAFTNCGVGGGQCGTVFELMPTAGGSWTETVLHNFNGTDGYSLRAGLIFDGSGNLYGTTFQGGAYAIGTVFELTPTAGGSWTETVLFNFNDAGGDYPAAGLILDATGNLYGTTSSGGDTVDGTVFEVTP